jgi:TusA-related sulfurtransferase
MHGSQLLEVRVNDPTAREDIASWCRLSGHELVAEVEESPQLLRVFIRKRQS